MYTGQSITLTLTDLGIAELTLDTKKSSVNVLNTHLLEELGNAIQLLKLSNHVSVANTKC